jgi:hypothetical protein
MPKRKLENGERRLPPQSHQSRGEIPEFASQRLGRASLTRGNVGGSHTRGKSLVETALAGCPSWIHIEPCVVPRSPLFGRFLRTFELFASPPDQVDEFRDHPPRGHPDRAADFVRSMSFGTTPPGGIPTEPPTRKPGPADGKAIIPSSRGARISPLTQGVG